MFSDVIDNISWEETTQKIYSKTKQDVEQALYKNKLDIEDFMALLSPAATPYIEEMAQLSQKYTLERFGNTMNLFIPIYITNSCGNACVYCGFNCHNKTPRIILNDEEMTREFEAIKKLGPYDNLLIVTGENPNKAGVPYIGNAIDIAKKYFHNIQIEVMPLKSEEYSELRTHGLDGVICFQETYHREKYKTYHPAGMKSNYEWRLNGFDRMGQAGIHKIGMGVLIGLEEWRTDITMMAIHLRYLQNKYWKTQFSVNFPRMREANNGGFQPNVVISDLDLAQATFAMRIFDHDVDISYSTREAAELRDNMCTLGVTTMSAESQTDPGGYACYPSALEQFHIADGRKTNEICEALRHHDRIPVFKNWDSSFDNQLPHSS